jgi:hypothetical protein
LTLGTKVTIKTLSSDYYGLTGLVVQEFPSRDPTNVRYYVAFDQTELRKAKRPEIVLKSKSNIVYFAVNELEKVINVSA